MTDHPAGDGDAGAGELRKHGTAASPGVAIGRAFLIDRRKLKVKRCRVEEDELDAEEERFRRAIRKSEKQLERIKEQIAETEADDYNIITAHQLMLRDEHLVDETVRNIRGLGVNAEWALRNTVTRIKRVFEAVDDDYFRERRSDIDFVGERVLRNLLGRESTVTPPPDAVVIAHDLSPADTALLHRAAIAGIVTESGARTSHTAIVARAHRLPAVVGVDDVAAVANTGDLVIVDGSAGTVIISPEPTTVAEYRQIAIREAAHGQALLENCDLPAVTTDGAVEVGLLANIDHLDELPMAIRYGAGGVGLFRTEFMFMSRPEFPHEQEHVDQAHSVMAQLGGRTATLRTFDFGADKVTGLFPELHHEANPALGLRSMRLCLQSFARPMFKAQLRGILRASADGPIRLMFPMISGVEELDAALGVLDEARRELREEGTAFDEDLPVGIMVEMPSAVMIAEHLAKRVDFFSIGTNDLIQYTLAVDRVNEQVSYLYEPLHPAVLRLIKLVVDAGKAHGVGVSVCGEMAGDPTAAGILIGLGVRELSMHAVAIPEVKEAIRGQSSELLTSVANAVLTLSTGAEVRALAESRLGGDST